MTSSGAGEGENPHKCEGDECEAVCKRLCVRGKNVRMYIAM